MTMPATFTGITGQDVTLTGAVSRRPDHSLIETQEDWLGRERRRVRA